MFWNKKKEKEPEIKECKVDKNLFECNSILNLRNYQQQLDQIKNTSIAILFKKHFNIDNSDWKYERYFFDIECRLNEILVNKKCKNFEQKFREFGKDLDNYFFKEKTIQELEDKINEEKIN